MNTLIDAALTWRAQDRDADTVARLDELIAGSESGDSSAQAELAAAFAGPLEFGTAGLRGPLGPGPARMNRVVVTQAAAGFGRWLIAAGHQGGNGHRRLRRPLQVGRLRPRHRRGARGPGVHAAV